MGAKPLFFGQTVIFFGQKPAAKNEKKYFSFYLLNEKTEFIPSSEMRCPKFGILLIFIG